MRRIAVAGFSLGRAEKRYLSRVVDSQRLSYGPFSRRFEASFAKMHGRRHGVFCNSGTSALHAAVAELKRRYRWKNGDEVLVPAVTFVATPNVLLHNGLAPVFVDVDPRTYCIDPDLLEKAATRRTRAVMPVHLLGMPADMGKIMAAARRRRWRVIEDCCEAVLARCGGKAVGSFGDVGCFSTYTAHQVVTGTGGLALTNDAGLAVRLRSLVNHGRDHAYLDIDAGKGKQGAALSRLIDRRFKFVALGHSFRPTELEAALGVGQLERARALVRVRQALARRLSEKLADLQDVIQRPQPPRGSEHTFMNYGLVVREGNCAGLVRYLEKRGVETRPLLPLLSQPGYAAYFRKGRFPVARWLERSGFYIGCHPLMTFKDADYVAAQVHGYFGR